MSSRPLSRREWASLALVVATAFALNLAWQTRPKPARQLTLTPVVRAVLADPGSPRTGAADADVTIAVFTDYQCPICKTTDPALQRLIATDRRVRVVFKDWPIFGEASKAAARAALIADRQGRYLAFHRALMGLRVKPDREQIERIAGSVGIDWPRLQRDEAALRPALERQLGGHAMQAWSLGLQGTPAYLIGLRLYEGGLGDRQLAQAVRLARAERRAK